MINSKNKPNLIILFLGLLLLFPIVVNGQSNNIGTPPIYSFSKEQYHNSSQNWNIAQGKEDIMYFANNSGLLVFDGKYWRCYQVSNQTKVRSVKIGNDRKIYVGAEGEMGYFSPNSNGELRYTSLNRLLPEKDRKFADVWDIEVIGERIFFRTGSHIFLYEKGNLQLILSSNELNHMTVIDGVLYTCSSEKGLLRLNGDTFELLYSESIFRNKAISGILPFSGDTLLVSTLSEGLFLCFPDGVQPWKSPIQLLSKGRISKAIKTSKDNFILGTSDNGIFILNKNGQVIQHINQQSGLQVNKVLSLFLDRFENLWVGLDNGIDYIEISSPFSYIYPDKGLKAMSYAVQIHNNRIYFGTSSGVYWNDWKLYYDSSNKNAYQLVENSEGQVWNLSTQQGNLFLNHHNGIFTIKNQKADAVFNKNGGWMQLPVGENKLIAGQYNGLLLLENKNAWQVTQNFFHNWRESCRIIVKGERNYIWVSHPYQGIFKIEFNGDFSAIQKITNYNSKDGFPSDLQLYVFKIEEEALFCTQRGIYKYNEAQDRFEPNEKWNAILGKNTWVKRLTEAPNGDIWYVTEDEVGLLDVKNSGVYKTVKKRVFPQLKGRLVDDFEYIYPYDDENIFIATEDCFIHYNPQHTSKDSIFKTLIRKVQLIKNDSIIYGGHRMNISDKQHISFKNNSIRFQFTSTYFAHIDRNEFQFYLEGFDEKWHDWTTKSEVEYTNLQAGNYTFHARGKNINGIISEKIIYQFRIAPPWYASILAKIIYALLSMAALFFLLFIPQRRFKDEKAALQSEQKEVMQQKEEEKQAAEKVHQQQITQLEREKLQLQIQTQTQELTNNTMHLVQKSEMLQIIKSDVQKISKLSTEPNVVKELRKVIKKVSTDEHLDSDWEQFAQYFDQVHEQFLQRLRRKFPQLTPKDHRLCAYLRMNLSSKEIAPLMNISVRSVEVARYRLRKKLKIEGDVNLVAFILEV
jgi:ligand-binding sensor domain-containing protein/DNA-binding CsgD family transcriptional regulator